MSRICHSWISDMGVQKAAVIQAHVECRVVRNPGGWVHAYRGGANSHGKSKTCCD